jgi:hypothetical protein
MAKAYFAIDPGRQLEIDYPIRGLDDVKTLAHNYWLRDIDPRQDVPASVSRQLLDTVAWIRAQLAS